MAASPSPTVRRKRLGAELRRLRERSGLTCEQVGRRLECSGTRISRIETGRITPRPGDVRELLDTYGVTGAAADALVQLGREARRKGWWHAYNQAIAPWFQTYLGMEAEAIWLREFQPLAMPGLLQTEDYARAVLRSAPAGGSGDAIDQQVAMRLQRQAIFARAAPRGLATVLSEAVLRTQIDGTVMAGQLRHLLDITRCANVTVQVVPLGSPALAQQVGAFTMLEFAELADPPVVYVEHLTGGLFLESGPDVRRYGMVFDHLRSAALGSEQSADLIAGILREPG